MASVVETIDFHINNTYISQGQIAPANLCTGEQSMVINNIVASQGS